MSINKPKSMLPSHFVKTVIKRDGREVPVAFDKITRRIRALSQDLNVEPSFVTQQVTRSMVDRMNVSQIDELAAQESAFMIRKHIDYLTLAGRLIVSNLHKLTPSCFSEAMEIVHAQSLDYDYTVKKDGFFTNEFIQCVRKHAPVLDAAIRHDMDYTYDYFAIRTMINGGYMNKINRPEEKIIERPQYVHMRVALFLNMDDIPTALKTYKELSNKMYTHASPTIFNAGKRDPQMSSCFLLQIADDSLDCIYDTLKQCAMISKHAGGIGLSVHKIRATGALIKSSGGLGDGLVPMLQVYNKTARYVNQGGKRKGAFAIYLEPWHADIRAFIELKKNRGNEEERARDLHYAMWIPDLFMRRVENDEMWSLFSPDTAPGLSDVYGKTFDDLYERYEKEGRSVNTVKARSIWEMILESQIETGEPYILYKDACNEKSNQKNLGTIQNSNLCVAGNTPLLTRKGYFDIETLVDQTVDVWNGKEWSTVVVQKTSEQSPLMKITFSDGSSLECTDYHKFYDSNNTEKRARELAVGDVLCGVDFGVADLCNDTSSYDPYQIPINAPLKQKIKALEKLFYSHMQFEQRQIQVLSGRSDSFLQQLRRMLHTMGIGSKITFHPSSITDNGDTFIEKYILTIQPSDVKKLVEFGCAFMSIPTDYTKAFDCETKFNLTVTSIEQDVRQAPTYCFKEPREQKGVFNGILTGNCAEILEYTSADEVAVCNLSSICLPSFVDLSGSFDQLKRTFNYQRLYDVTYLITKNLNRVIDLNYYPIAEAKNSNLKHRPIGIGVQGLADVFCMMMLPFESEEAREINRNIFETIYFAAVTASKDLAKQYGPYETYKGSPASQGLLQFDLWNIKPSARHDWDGLKREIGQHGLRNSLLVALMPTASTAQLMGNNEGCEAYTRNLYVRRTGSGEFIVANKHLAHLLSSMDLWTDDIIDQIVSHDGSIQYIKEIPDDIKRVFKTTFEVKSKPIIDMSADRGPYVCQTQSMNLWVESPTPQMLTTMHFYGWKKGLKTGMYYLRSKALTGAQKFVIDPSKVEQAKQEQKSAKEEKKMITEEKKTTQEKQTSEEKLGDKPKQPKTYEKNGKTYTCTDDVCVSCGS
jgi:ribonucleotide reductase alpha subunit